MNKTNLKSDLISSTIVLVLTILMPVFTVFVIPKLYTAQELALYSNSLFFVQVAAAVASFGINTILRRDYYRGLIVNKNQVCHHAIFISSPSFILVVLFSVVARDLVVMLCVSGYYFVSIYINYLRVSNSFKELALIEVLVNNLIPISAMLIAPAVLVSRFELLSILVVIIAMYVIIKMQGDFSFDKKALKVYIEGRNKRRVLHNFVHVVLTQINKRGEYFFIAAVLSSSAFASFNYAYLFLNFVVIVSARAVLVLERYLMTIRFIYLMLGLVGYVSLVSIGVIYLLPGIIEHINSEYLGYLEFIKVLLFHTVSILVLELFSTKLLLSGKEKLVSLLTVLKSIVLLFIGVLLSLGYVSMSVFYFALVTTNLIITIYIVYDHEKLLSKNIFKRI